MGGTRACCACAWFLFVAAVDAAPGYLAQRLAEHGLAMAEFAQTGRGVRTERDRAAGERVFYWFDKEVVFAERALERRADVAAAAAAAAAAGAPLADEAILALYLALEAQDPRDNWFSLYRSTLPAAPPTPTAADAALLPRCYAACCAAAAERAAAHHGACARACAAAGVAPPARGAFLDALAHVSARAFAVDDEAFRLRPPRHPHVRHHAPAARRALLPLLDLLNHRDGARVRLERSEKAWRLVADDAYAAGGEVFNSYGARGNLELLLNYGFAVVDNPQRRVAFDADDLVAAARAAGAAAPREALEAALAAPDRAAGGLGLYTLDATAGPTPRLRAALAVLAARGGPAAAPGAVLGAALGARRDEVAVRLRDAARDPAGGPLRDAVLALLEAERDVVAGMLEADGAR